MSTVMYDSTDYTSIPTGATMVAGYIDGRYAWSSDAWNSFPNARKVKIAVFPTTQGGDVLDVENGDATPAQAVSWVQARRNAGADPVVYCNRSTWPQVTQAFTAAGVAQPLYWIADWTWAAHIPSGAVACQWGAYGRFDVSEVGPDWPGGAQAEAAQQLILVRAQLKQIGEQLAGIVSSLE